MREARGYVYVGPVHAEEAYVARICPWCIASGRAHEELEERAA
ncbi:MAG: CbrC family protein [Myxococcota bacterium]